MAIGTVITIAVLSIFLIVVLTYFLAPGAIIPKAAEAAESIADDALTGIKKHKQEKSTLEVDKSIEESYENILAALRTEGETPCVIESKPLASDFKGFKIIISDVEEGAFVQLIDKNGRIAKTNTVSGKTPCIIKPIVFYNNHLGPTPCESDCKEDYSDASAISLDSNKILYKPDKKHVCFITTGRWVGTNPFSCDANENNLDNDCLEKIEEIKKC